MSRDGSETQGASGATSGTAPGKLALGALSAGALTAGGRFWRLALLAVATLAVFWPALEGELVYDDLYAVGQNPLIRSFERLPEIFGSAYWSFLDEESAGNLGYYRPLSSLALTLGYALGQGAPAAFHALSILAHLAAALAAWLFAARLSGDERLGFFAALLFALHPVQVESVAWISAINVPLFGLFALLSLAAYLRWRQRGSQGLPIAAGVLLLLALGCKEAALSVVPIAIAVDWSRARKGARTTGEGWARTARAYLPFAAAIVLYGVARILTFGDWKGGFDRALTDFGVGAARLAMLRVEVLGGSLGLLALPRELDLFRPFLPGLAPSSSAFLVPLALSLALLAGIVALAARRAGPLLAMALVIPAGLLPMLIDVRHLGAAPLSERFLYLPVLGFTMLLAALAITRLPRPAAILALALVAAGYAWRSRERIPDWRDELTLFGRAAEQHPRNPNVHWGLGRALLQQYRDTGDPDTLTQARAAYDRAMDLLEEAARTGLIYATSDDHRQTNLGLAWSLLFEAEIDGYRDYKPARTVFQRVTARYPDYSFGWVGLGVAYAREGRPDEAGAALRRALELNPSSAEAHHNMAALLMTLGDWKGAERHYRMALELRPERLELLIGLARALELQDRRQEAYRTAFQARAAHPRSGHPALILGNVSMLEGRPTEALRWFDEAVALDPNFGPAHSSRGKVLAAMQEPKEAARAFQRASELLPESFEAVYNLAVLLLASETPKTALPALVRAYALRRNDQVGAAVHEKLRELEIDQPHVLWQLAATDADRGEHARAMEWARAALAIDPDHAPSHLVVGLILQEEGRLEAAYVHLLQAAIGMSDSYTAQAELGELLVAMGRPQEGLPFLKRALTLLKREPIRPDIKEMLAQVLAREVARLEEDDDG